MYSNRKQILEQSLNETKKIYYALQGEGFSLSFYENILSIINQLESELNTIGETEI